MALTIPPGFTQINVKMNLLSSIQTAECTFGTNYTASTDLQAVADAWRDEVMPHISNVWTYVEATAREAAGAIFTASYSAAGGVADSPCPPNTCALVRKLSILPGRRNKGRLYLPGIREDQVDGAGNLNSSLRTALQTAMDSFHSAVEAIGSGGLGQMVILHDSSLGTAPPTTVTGLQVQSLAATQRRRMRG
jgi:hypothetical protein